MNSEEWKPLLLDLFKKRPGTSFAEITRLLPNSKGEFEFGVLDKNIVFWQGLEQPLIHALSQLEKDGKIKYEPCSIMIYLIDGLVPRLPVVKRNRAYKSPHWLPITIHITT